MKQFLFAFFLFCVTSIQAQKHSYPLYLRADLGLSNVKTDHGKASSTFAVGIGAESFVKLKKLKEVNLVLSPNLSYLHTGYESSGGGNVKVNYISLALPIGLHISDNADRFDGFGLFVGAGPFINLATSGKFRVYSIDDYSKMKFGNSNTDNRRSTDAGLVLKATLGMGRLYLGMQDNIGMSNLVPKDRVSNGSYIKSRNFLFYISYAIK
jgi:hypothetical protein